MGVDYSVAVLKADAPDLWAGGVGGAPPLREYCIGDSLVPFHAL